MMQQSAFHFDCCWAGDAILNPRRILFAAPVIAKTVPQACQF